MPRSRYHHGDLRAALVAAGREALEEKGLAGLSLRAIAARAGVSHAAPHNHFPSLRHLLTAIAADGFRQHASFLRARLGDATDPRLRRRRAIDAYVAFAAESPELFALMFSKHHVDFADPGLRAAAGASYAVLAEVAASDALPPDQQERERQHLWSLAHGHAVLMLAGFFQGEKRLTPSDLIGDDGAHADPGATTPFRPG